MIWILIVTFHSAYAGRVPLKLGPFPDVASCRAASTQISIGIGQQVEEMVCVQVPKEVR